jgi:hypothetical protein
MLINVGWEQTFATDRSEKENKSST